MTVGNNSASPKSDVGLFAELLSVSTVGRFLALSITPQRRKEWVLERFAAQLAGLAAREPILMILEDAHWIDPTTQELFDITVERVRTLPVLLIITYRPEFTPPGLGQQCLQSFENGNRISSNAKDDRLLGHWVFGPFRKGQFDPVVHE
jgi:predicted ATPase